MSFKCYGVTDIGSKRVENQDCYGIYTFGAATLCIVCDGMGGHAGGATASGTARDVFVEAVRDTLGIYGDDEGDGLPTAAALRRALERGAVLANSAVRTAADNAEDLAGMGTTLVAVLLCEGVGGCFVNVGDSRIYDVTEAAITQISHDHSYVQHLVDMGQMSADEARVSPVRNVITRAVGIDDTVRPDIRSVDISLPPDGKRWFLLCSDGAFRMRQRGDNPHRGERRRDPARKSRGACRACKRGGRSRQHYRAYSRAVTDGYISGA